MNGRNFTCERTITKNFSELFRQHFTRETCTGKKKLRTSKHIRAVTNFLDVARERGRPITRSSPEGLFAKSFQKTDPAAIFVETRGSQGKAGLAA